MIEKQIPQTDVDRLLARLRQRAAVYAPTEDGTGEVVLAALSGKESVTLEYRNFRLSPKALVLPQNQTLLCFKDGQAADPGSREARPRRRRCGQRHERRAHAGADR